jgi:cellulose synthase/poly-beta-1,6-N-acetylglucosamine synthase-like glycosyltransferase
MPFWLSLWHPALVAYVIITFDVYWFYKSFSLAISAVKSFLTLQAHSKIQWLPLAKKHPQFSKLHHIIIVPEYKEPLHILEQTIDDIAAQSFPTNRIIVVLGTESKDTEAEETITILTKKYQDVFEKFLVTRHPLVVGEVAGKSSNMAFAGKAVAEYVKEKRLDPSLVTITSCDADARLHPEYLSCLSERYLNDPEKLIHFYQGAILFYSNIWRIPLPNKFFNTINSIGNLAVLSQTSRLINFSTYSLSFQTVSEIGFWDVDIIPEDYHLFFKTYFAKGEGVRVVPIFLPILVDAAESHGFYKTFVNQYEQSKRWAWGVSDIPYVIRNAVLSSSIPAHDRIRRILRILEHHIFWPANWFLLTIGSTIPPLINPAFERTVLGHSLSQISSSILTLSTIFLLLVFYIDWKTKPPRPKEFAAWKLPFLYLQWFTLPIISFFLSALPGLDAHTRLMLGQRLEYRVTEKV